MTAPDGLVRPGSAAAGDESGRRSPPRCAWSRAWRNGACSEVADGPTPSTRLQSFPAAPFAVLGERHRPRPRAPLGPRFPTRTKRKHTSPTQNRSPARRSPSSQRAASFARRDHARSSRSRTPAGEPTGRLVKPRTTRAEPPGESPCRVPAGAGILSAATPVGGAGYDHDQPSWREFTLRVPTPIPSRLEPSSGGERADV